MRRRVFYFLSIPAFAIMYSYTAVLVLIVLLLSYMRWRRGVTALMNFWARSLFPIMLKRLRIKGKQNYSKKQNYIILANHASLFDIVAIMAQFPGVSWFGHERLLKIPLFNQMLIMADYIPMSLANVKNTRRMLSQLVEKSKHKTIAIFPEGTRTLDGKLNPFYRGFIYLLKASELDILPVTLTGFFKLKPKNRFHINFRSKLEITIHPPIPGKELLQLEDKQIIERVRTVIESASDNADT